MDSGCSGGKTGKNGVIGDSTNFVFLKRITIEQSNIPFFFTQPGDKLLELVMVNW